MFKNWPVPFKLWRLIGEGYLWHFCPGGHWQLLACALRCPWTIVHFQRWKTFIVPHFGLQSPTHPALGWLFWDLLQAQLLNWCSRHSSLNWSTRSFTGNENSVPLTKSTLEPPWHRLYRLPASYCLRRYVTEELDGWVPQVSFLAVGLWLFQNEPLCSKQHSEIPFSMGEGLWILPATGVCCLALRCVFKVAWCFSAALFCNIVFLVLFERYVVPPSVFSPTIPLSTVCAFSGYSCSGQAFSNGQRFTHYVCTSAVV